MILYYINIKAINNESIGEAIREARLAKGLSQVAVASRIGVGKRTLCSYEKSVRRIHAPQLLQLAKILNISIDSLLEQDFQKVDGRSRSAYAIKELNRFQPEDQKIVFNFIDSLASKQAALAK